MLWPRLQNEYQPMRLHRAAAGGPSHQHMATDILYNLAGDCGQSSVETFRQPHQAKIAYITVNYRGHVGSTCLWP